MKTVLITGTNRGIGLGLVKYLIQQKGGPSCVIAACRNPEKAEVLQELSKNSPNLHILQLGSSRDDQTLEESIKLLHDIDRLETEASDLHTDISALEAKLASTQSKPYDDEPHYRDTVKVTPDPSNTENYAIKLNHKFYEFTGVSVKSMAHNMITVFFYIKHDDWATDIRPYWLKIEIVEIPKVISYDLPFMTEMKEIQTSHPIDNNDDLFNFINYVQRCIDSYFERRQQVRELENLLNSARAKVTTNMQYTLVQIKFLWRKSAPEIRFSIWYLEIATRPHKCIVRILEGSHKELVKNLTNELIALNEKPLPEAFIEGTQKYTNLQSSSEESSSESDESVTLDLKSWFYQPETNPSKKSGAARVLSKNKRGRGAKVMRKRPSKHDDGIADGSILRRPPAKRSTKGNDGGQRETSEPKVASRKRVDTPSKYDTMNWRKSTVADDRKSRQAVKSVRAEYAGERNDKPAQENTSVESKKAKQKSNMGNSQQKSAHFKL